MSEHTFREKMDKAQTIWEERQRKNAAQDAEEEAYRIAAKMCPTCRLRDNNYCRDVFHDSAL